MLEIRLLRLPVLFAALLLGLGACKSSQEIAQPAPRKLNVDSLVLAQDEPAWLPDPTPYQPAQALPWRLLHTDLDVTPNWAQSTLAGVAQLQLTPWFYPQEQLVLDAKSMDIQAVRLLQADTAAQALPFGYDSLKLRIELPRTYQRGDTLALQIAYTAFPEQAPKHSSQAIVSAKGLYFIDPKGEHPYKPTQLWTQGETEHSSRWFPTLDQPNARTTQRLALTVPDSMLTVSNGELVRRDFNADGSRTDHWELQQSHAPYLFMMAAGPFAKQAWTLADTLEVSVYLDSAYAEYADLIFGRTDDMIAFFSEKFGVNYPWPKYAQVVVHDFVSGAMENTSATIHMNALQHDARAHLDRTYEEYISHELVHQWFGDLVTCESWSQIALNEAFATYGEYLWIEHYYGRQEADHHLQDLWDGYLAEAETKREPLIRYHYVHPEDVFDAHSYNKGACLLHWLRSQVGDEAFFASLKHYLNTHAYSSVEVEDLRLAFEEVTGRDLRSFFQDWWGSRGHPVLDLQQHYIDSTQQLQLELVQRQNTDHQPLYDLHTELRLYGQGPDYPKTVRIRLNSRKQSHTLRTPPGFLWADLDPERVLPIRRLERKPHAQWWAQLRQGAYRQRSQALQRLAVNLQGDSLRRLLETALQDSFWALRQQALHLMQDFYRFSSNATLAETLGEEGLQTRVAGLLLYDSDARVRLAAAELLAAQDSLAPIASSALRSALQDSSYAVLAEALQYQLHQQSLGGDTTAALELARNYSNLRSDRVRTVVGGFYLEAGAPKAVRYALESLVASSNPRETRNQLKNLGEWLQQAVDSLERVQDTTPPQLGLGHGLVLAVLQGYATNSIYWYVRMQAVRELIGLKQIKSVRTLLEQIQQDQAEVDWIRNMIGYALQREQKPSTAQSEAKQQQPQPNTSDSDTKTKARKKQRRSNSSGAAKEEPQDKQQDKQ